MEYTIKRKNHPDINITVDENSTIELTLTPKEILIGEVDLNGEWTRGYYLGVGVTILASLLGLLIKSFI